MSQSLPINSSENILLESTFSKSGNKNLQTTNMCVFMQTQLLILLSKILILLCRVILSLTPTFCKLWRMTHWTLKITNQCFFQWGDVTAVNKDVCIY